VTPHRLVRRIAPFAAAMALLVACGQPSDDAPAGAAPEEGEPDLAHVHGLGVDPADGTLYAASHHGVFRIPTGSEPERVSEVQDTMGFTVVGPGRFLGSGHPAPDDTSRPPHL
jgi:hypothetical protein